MAFHPRHLCTVPIAAVSFAATFLVVGRLVCFLSTPTLLPVRYTWLLNMLDDRSRWETALPALTVDCCLAIVFVLQHSLMRTRVVRSAWRRVGLETVERSLYNLATAYTLNFVIANWRSVPTFIVWQADVQHSPTLWWLHIAVHTLAWAIIFGGTVLMDLAELLGVKQVVYDVQGFLGPMLYKSDELKRLFGHVRHPSFVGISLVLFAANTMSVDRLLLAVLWSVYMFVAWNTDEDDVQYHRCQLARKREELKRCCAGESDGIDGVNDSSGLFAASEWSR